MPSDINFDYFTTHDFHSNQDIINCLSSTSLSFLNCNIRSLQANFDNLVNMLSELYYPISVIGVTEKKLKNDREILLNINITGYSFLSQPSYTNAGGVRFYKKNYLGYIHRSDLLARVQNDFESHVLSSFIRLHWLPIKFRINFKIAMFCFKGIHGHAPNYLKSMVAIKKTSTYNLRSSTSIQLEDHSRRSKKTLGDRAFSNASAKIWNSLPQS